MRASRRLCISAWRRALPSALCTLTVAALVGCADDPTPDQLQVEALGAAQQPLTCVTLRRPLTTTGDATIATDPLDPTRATANTGSALLLGVGTQGTATLQSLLSFDLSSIPANVPIASATLRLTKASSQGPGSVLLHPATAPWSEGGVTFSNFAAAFSPNVVATLTPSTIPNNGNALLDVTSVVSQWNAGTLANYGLLLEEPGGGRIQLASSEAVAARKPQLTVCYQPATCSDGLQNQGEGGVDCGGPCAPCVVNLCVGVTCTALDSCHVAGTCNPTTGVCDNPAAPAGVACNDANACTTGDACDGAGTCAGATVSCAPPGACQLAGVCDPQSGACSYAAAPDGTPCADADVCNGGETCQAGQCTSGAPPTCNDGLACTVDSCATGVGCTAGVPFWKNNSESVEPFVFVLPDGSVQASVTGPQVTWDWCTVQQPSYTIQQTNQYDVQGNLTTLPTFGIGMIDAERVSSGDTYVIGSYFDPYWWSYIYYLSKMSSAGVVDWNGPYWTGEAFNALGVSDAGLVAGASYHYQALHVEVAQGDYFTGGLAWQNDFPSTGATVPHRLVVDAAGHTHVPVAITGSLTVGATTFSAPPGGTTLAVIELDGAGALVGSTQVSATGVGSFVDLAKDASGAILLTGNFSGSINFGGGPVASAGGVDGFVVKIAGGSVAWGRTFGGPGAEAAMAMTTGPSGSAHVTGTFAQGASFGAGVLATPNAKATFVAEYDGTTGAYLNARALRGVPSSIGIATDCSNHVVLAGNAASAADRLAAYGEAIEPKDGFVLKLGDPPADCGQGSCSGGAYCDACGCRPSSDPLSVVACGCGLVDPANGAGDCSAGAYCDGGRSATAQCYAADSPVNYALCQGGTLNAQCLPNLPAKHVFTTSQVYPPTFGGAAGGDAICQSLAQAAGHAGTYKAWLSDYSAYAKDRVAHGPHNAYALFDGTLVAKNWSDFVDGTHQHAIDLTELGTPAPVVPVTFTAYWGDTFNTASGVWTGSTDTGLSAASYDYSASGSIYCYGSALCSNWTGPDYFLGGAIGTLVAGAGWSYGGTSECIVDSLPLYCIEE